MSDAVWFLLGLLVALGMTYYDTRRRSRRASWPVVCGLCATGLRVGTRSQLYVELWDGYGQQYKQWAVGHGELMLSREVGPWLLAEITREVARLEAFQRGADTAPVGSQELNTKMKIREPRRGSGATLG